MKKSAFKTKDQPVAEDYKEKYQRALADYQNLSKQQQAEKIETIKYANSAVFNDLLPVYEYLKLSLEHCTESSSIIEGLKYTLNLFAKALADHGVSEIKVRGQKFNHLTMEAVETKETLNQTEDDTVAESRQTGYLLHDKVLRPARVVVYKLASEIKVKSTSEAIDKVE